MSEQLDYREFYNRIHGLVVTGAQGTLFARTDRNHLVIVAVRGGRIVSLACGPRHGEAAIPRIREMRSGEVRLTQGAIPYHERELPSTADILERLKPGAVVQPAPVEGAPVPRPAAVEADASGKSKALCKLLTRFVGPVAPLVCEEKVAVCGGLDAPDKVDAVIRALAEEVLEGDEAEQFMAQARALLQTESPPRPAGEVPGAGRVRVDLPRAKAVLCDLLTDYLGPVAPLLCEEKIATLQGDGDLRGLEAALEDISRELDDRDEAREFIAEARKRLDPLRI